MKQHFFKTRYNSQTNAKRQNKGSRYTQAYLSKNIKIIFFFTYEANLTFFMERIGKIYTILFILFENDTIKKKF